MHLVSCTNTHHDITDLVNHGMVKNTKTWISWEQNILFLQNKNMLSLCIRLHILQSYSFVADVTFKVNHFANATNLLDFSKSVSKLYKYVNLEKYQKLVNMKNLAGWLTTNKASFSEHKTELVISHKNARQKYKSHWKFKLVILLQGKWRIYPFIPFSSAGCLARCRDPIRLSVTSRSKINNKMLWLSTLAEVLAWI